MTTNGYDNIQELYTALKEKWQQQKPVWDDISLFVGIGLAVVAVSRLGKGKLGRRRERKHKGTGGNAQKQPERREGFHAKPTDPRSLLSSHLQQSRMQSTLCEP